MAILPLIAAISGLLPLLAVADYVLYTGEVLIAGQNLTNGRYRLAMQTDCDVVLYDGENPTWRTSTAGKGGHDCYLGLKQTGELVVRRGVHYTLWSSSSKAKKGKYALVLDQNGNLDVYGQRRWTSSNQKEDAKFSRPVISTDYVLFSGQRMTATKKLRYNEFEVSLTRCNLVIKDVGSGKLLWQTNTKQDDGKKSAKCNAQLEADGELVIRHGDEHLWSTNRKYEGGDYIAVLRFDGRLNIYGPMVWSNYRSNEKDSHPYHTA